MADEARSAPRIYGKQGNMECLLSVSGQGQREWAPVCVISELQCPFFLLESIAVHAVQRKHASYIQYLPTSKWGLAYALAGYLVFFVASN